MAADQDGQTPLHMAARNGDVQCLKWLVSHGASVNATNGYGETPLHLAIKVGFPEFNRQWTAMGRSNADLFTDDLTVKDEKWCGIECLLELLANSEVNINVSDNDGITPLMVAVLFGTPQYLQWLLDAGADLYVNDYHSWTPLHFAAFSDCEESINVLLAVVPQINISKKDIHGWTALHIAAKNDCLEALKVLLDTPGTQVNEKDNKGLTAFHIAAKFDNKESLRILLDTPHQAQEEGSQGHDRAPLRCPIRQCRLHQDTTGRCRIRANKKNKKGWTALHLAAKHDSAKSIEKLLETPGIRVNKRTTRGWTALHLAAKYDSAGSIRILLNHPDIQANKKTDSGKTALHIAANTAI